MSLRPRQQKAVSDVSNAYRRGFNSPVMIAPTGFGKTHTSAHIIERAISRGNRVWFLAHLKEILNATEEKLADSGIKFGSIARGKLGDRRHMVQVCSVQTLVNRLDRLEPPQLMIVDEAHLAVANTYQRIFQWAKAGPKFYSRGGTHLLHLTATPQRLDGRGMGEVADCLIPTCSTQELIDEGLLSSIRYFSPTTIDVSNVATRGGDFANDGLDDALEKSQIVGDAVESYTKYAKGRPAIGFCINIKRAEEAAERFRAAGYRAMAISGDSDAVLRDSALEGLQDGSLDVVFNCALWVAGVDAPAVSCIIQLNPTKSIVKYLQSIGRGLRTHPGKEDCIILDHVGNLARHGDPAAAREWTLSSATKRKGSKRNEVPEKKCPKCFASVFAAATHCACGHYFEPQEREIEEVEGELKEVDLKAQKVAARQEQGAAQTEKDLVELGRKRGHKRPELWARHVMRARKAKQKQLGA